MATAPASAEAWATPTGAPESGPIVVRDDETGTPPWVTSPPRISCPPPLRAELDRLLASVSAHASKSQGCIDGPGDKTTVSLLGVRASGGRGQRWVRIRYGTVQEDTGGMRGCANGGCDTPTPRWAIAEISLRFTRTSGGYRMTLPKKWPAVGSQLQPMTPLDHEHDGKCYGRTPPFSPATLQSW